MSTLITRDSASSTPSGHDLKAATRRNCLSRYAPLSLDVMQVGVILVGSFMVYVPGLLICAALSFAIFVLRVLAHRAAQKGVAHE
jgi:hypothetical protein